MNWNCLWVLFFATLFIYGCGEQSKMEEVEQQDAYGYTEKFTRNKEDFAKQGKYQKFNEQGTLVEESNFVNDTLDGSRMIYAENGDVQIVETYTMGIFEGPYLTYHENGKVEQEGQYAKNEMIGVWKKFYDNGQLMESVQFEANQENGPFIEYYEDGSLKAKGSYLDGDNEHGLLELFDSTGTLIRKMNCENGICRTFWKAEGIE